MGNEMFILVSSCFSSTVYYTFGITFSRSFLLHVSSSLLLTVEALMSGHPQNTKKVSVTKAGRFWGCKNIEILWELRKTGFCVGKRK